MIGPKEWKTSERNIAVEDLFAGYFETVLAKNELIAALRIPAQGKTRAAYMKVTTGSAEDWPALGVAVALDMAGDHRQVGAGRRQRRDREGDAPQERRASARRRDRGRQDLGARGDAAADEAECVTDVRGSAAYKRELVRVYVGRAVRKPCTTSANTNGATN